MNKHSIIPVLCIITLLSGTALAQNTKNMVEPHGSEDHDYLESVYGNGELITLQEAILRAIKASPRLASSYAKLDAAKGTEEQAAYWPNPQLNLEAENFAGSSELRGTDRAEYTVSFNQTIEIGGKRSARKDAAKAMRNAITSDVLSEKLNLERDVHIAYSEVLAEAEAVKLAIEQEKVAKEVLDTVAKRVELAAEPEIQHSKAEVAYLTSTIAREQEQYQLRIAKEKLARLWGESVFDGSLDHAHFFELKVPLSLKTYKDKLRRLPDFQKMAFLRLEKQALLKLELAQRIPDPEFSLGIREFKETNDQALVFGFSIPFPILNQNKGNISRANAELNQQESDTRLLILQLEQSLLESWQGWSRSFVEAKRLSENIIPAANRAFNLSRVGYEKGSFSYLEVLDAQRTLFNARAQFHDALKRYHSSRANVERLSSTIEFTE